MRGLDRVRLPLPHQKSMQMLAAPSDLIQIPVQPSHHMANVPVATASASISSFNQVPHSGNVLNTHDSFVISSILLMFATPRQDFACP